LKYKFDEAARRNDVKAIVLTGNFDFGLCIYHDFCFSENGFLQLVEWNGSSISFDLI
jgi:hypothetical protein